MVPHKGPCGAAEGLSSISWGTRAEGRAAPVAVGAAAESRAVSVHLRSKRQQHDGTGRDAITVGAGRKAGEVWSFLVAIIVHPKRASRNHT